MKTSTALIVAVTSAVFTFACGASQTTTLEPTSAVPAAQGTVESVPTDNGNTSLTVQVKHLAPPERVASGASTYVVWVKPVTGDGIPRNIGALVVDKDRTGELRSLTPLKAFDVTVTAESSGKAISPSAAEVFKATVAQ